MSDPVGLISGAGGPLRPQMPIGGAGVPTDPNAPGFKDYLLKNLEQVNSLQRDATEAIEDIATGKRDDLENVLLAKEKADNAFRMLLQVRNKVMDAYEELKQIRV